jgi:hypothetical protein
MCTWRVRGLGVETLLDGGADGDVVEAEAAIERLAAAPTDDGHCSSCAASHRGPDTQL